MEDDTTDSVINGLRSGMNSVQKIVKESYPICTSDEDRNAMLSRMEKALLKLIRAEIAYSKATDIVNEIVQEMPADDEATSTASTDEIIRSCDQIAVISNERMKEYEAEIDDETLRKHAGFIAFKDVIKKLKAGQARQAKKNSQAASEEQFTEVDLDISNSQTRGRRPQQIVIPTIDPITKKTLTDPVRNNICNHVYGKQAVLDLISSNPRTRCPTVGCDNKHFLKIDHLIDDSKDGAAVVEIPVEEIRTERQTRLRARRAKN